MRPDAMTAYNGDAGTADEFAWYDLTPLAIDAILHGVNDVGDYAGQQQGASGAIHAIYVRASTVVDLGTLGGSSSSARGLNNVGTVVGGALTENDEHHHAFVYADGVMHDLNTRISADGWELVHALAINDRGQIIAMGHHDGEDCMVLLTPRGS
jgi:probable HAF family extracellular repeat protein